MCPERYHLSKGAINKFEQKLKFRRGKGMFDLLSKKRKKLPFSKCTLIDNFVIIL